LALAQHLEDGGPYGTSVEEVLDPASIAYEPKPLVYQQPRIGRARYDEVMLIDGEAGALSLPTLPR